MSSEKDKKGKDIFDFALEGIGTIIEMVFVLILNTLAFMGKVLVRRLNSKNADKENTGLSPICAKIAKEHRETSHEHN